MKINIPNWLIIVGAIGQIFTALIYPYIRHVVFDWYNDIKKLKPLNQEIAKTYGRYIQGLNFSFGLISILFTEELKKIGQLKNGQSLIMNLFLLMKVKAMYLLKGKKFLPREVAFSIFIQGYFIL